MTTRQTPVRTPARPVLLASPLHHLAVVVADLGRAEAFYAGVLGLEVTVRHADASGAPRAVWLRLGAALAEHPGGDPWSPEKSGAFLALERASEAGPARADGAPGLHCLALPIAPDSRENWRRHLASAGHPVERESAFTLYLRDPDGCLVALSHHPTPADL